MAASLEFLEAFKTGNADLVLLFGNATAPAGGIECEALDILSAGFIYRQVADRQFSGREDETLLLHAGDRLPARLLWVGLGAPIRYWLDWADRCAERLGQWAGGMRLAHLMFVPPAFVNSDQADYRGWGKKWEPMLRAHDWLKMISVAGDDGLVEAYRV